MKLAEKVETLRKRKGLTQKDLASLIGINTTNLNRLENGHSQPSIEVLKKLSEALEVTADFLLNEDDDELEVQIKDKTLAEKVKLIDSLEEEDRKTIHNVIDSILTKERMKKVLEGKQLAS